MASTPSSLPRAFVDSGAGFSPKPRVLAVSGHSNSSSRLSASETEEKKDEGGVGVGALDIQTADHTPLAAAPTTTLDGAGKVATPVGLHPVEEKIVSSTTGPAAPTDGLQTQVQAPSSPLVSAAVPDTLGRFIDDLVSDAVSWYQSSAAHTMKQPVAVKRFALETVSEVHAQPASTTPSAWKEQQPPSRPRTADDGVKVAAAAAASLSSSSSMLSTGLSVIPDAPVRRQSKGHLPSLQQPCRVSPARPSTGSICDTDSVYSRFLGDSVVEHRSTFPGACDRFMFAVSSTVALQPGAAVDVAGLGRLG